MNERKKIVNNLLNRAKKLGLDMDKITEGKSIDTLARNSNTIKNLQKRFNRQKERPKIVEQVKKIDKRLERKKEDMEIEKRRNIKRNIINDDIKSELKWNHNITPDQINTHVLKDKTDKAIDDFFNRYFKEIKHENEFQKTLKKIKKRFGIRLDLAYDYMKYLGELSYKYEIPRELMKTDTISDFLTMMRDRLESFENIIGREFDL